MKGYFEHLRDQARGRFEAGHGLAGGRARHSDQGIRALDRSGARRRQRLFALQAMGPGDPDAPPPTLFAEMNKYRKEHA